MSAQDDKGWIGVTLVAVFGAALLAIAFLVDRHDKEQALRRQRLWNAMEQAERLAARDCMEYALVRSERTVRRSRGRSYTMRERECLVWGKESDTAGSGSVVEQAQP